MTEKKETDRLDDNAELAFERNLQQLNQALAIVEEHLGPESIAAAQINHRIGMELCDADVPDAAHRYCGHAWAIVQKHAVAMLLDIDCSDHLLQPKNENASEENN